MGGGCNRRGKGNTKLYSEILLHSYQRHPRIQSSPQISYYTHIIEIGETSSTYISAAKVLLGTHLQHNNNNVVAIQQYSNTNYNMDNTDVTIEDCSDDEYCNNNNSDEVNNNSNNIFLKLGGGRPLNIQVTAKVLFGSVTAITALNAERKKKNPSSKPQ